MCECVCTRTYRGQRTTPTMWQLELELGLTTWCHAPLPAGLRGVLYAENSTGCYRTLGSSSVAREPRMNRSLHLVNEQGGVSNLEIYSFLRMSKTRPSGHSCGDSLPACRRPRPCCRLTRGLTKPTRLAYHPHDFQHSSLGATELSLQSKSKIS